MDASCPPRRRFSASWRSPPLRRPDVTILASVALVAYVALGIGYATLTPIWQNPDEPAHFNYIVGVVRTGGLPELRNGDWDLPLLERLKTGTLRPDDDVGGIRYESWQPPLFYLLAVPVYRAGSTDLTSAVLRLRLFNVVLGAVTLGLAYAVGRQVLLPHLAFGPPLVLTGVPMFTSVSAAVSADPLANLLSAALVLVLVDTLRQPRCLPVRWSVGTAVLLGLGVLTKLAVGIFLPLVLVVLYVRAVRRWRAIAMFFAMLALVLSPWLVHQVTTYGLLDPLASARHNDVVLDQQRFPGVSLAWVVSFATITFHSFWAQFGWMAIVAPDRLYLVWGLLVVTALIGWARTGALLREPTWRLLLATAAAALIALVGYNVTFVQFQGRYLFTALVSIACGLVAGWAGCLPRRAQSTGLAFIGLLLVGLNAYVLMRVLVPGFAPPI